MGRISQNEIHRWLSRFSGSNKDLHSDAHEAFCAYIEITEGSNEISSKLPPILKAAESSRKLLAHVGIMILQDLGRDIDYIREVIRTLSSHKKARARLSCIACLGAEFPRGFLVEILPVFFNDKSKRNRWYSAQRAATLGLIELGSHLHEAIEREQDPETRDAMLFSYTILTSGYHLRKKDSGSYHLTVATQNGTRAIEVSQKDIDTHGIDALVSDLKGDNKRLEPKVPWWERVGLPDPRGDQLENKS